MRADAVIEIQKAIQAASVALGYKAYSEVAPDDATYPFLTYEQSNSSSDGEATESLYVDIDGWDNFTQASGTTRLETMMASMAKYLDQKLINATVGDTSIRFILYDRKMIRDPDSSIRRRKYMYEIRSIGKE